MKRILRHVAKALCTYTVLDVALDMLERKHARNVDECKRRHPAGKAR